MKATILGLDLAWLSCGAAQVELDTGRLAFYSAFTQPAKRVTEDLQQQRAFALQSYLHRLPWETIEAVFYESAEAWLLAKARDKRKQRHPVSTASILALGYAKATLWLSVPEDVKLYRCDPNRVRSAISTGIQVPDEVGLTNSAKDRLRGAVWLRTGDDHFVEKKNKGWAVSQHAVDAIAIAFVSWDYLRQGRQEELVR